MGPIHKAIHIRRRQTPVDTENEFGQVVIILPIHRSRCYIVGSHVQLRDCLYGLPNQTLTMIDVFLFFVFQLDRLQQRMV